VLTAAAGRKGRTKNYARSSTKKGIEIGRENERLVVPCCFIQGQEIVSTKRKTCFRRAISRLSLNIMFTRENREGPGSWAMQHKLAGRPDDPAEAPDFLSGPR
jgi:hypothetical protein